MELKPELSLRAALADSKSKEEILDRRRSRPFASLAMCVPLQLLLSVPDTQYCVHHALPMILLADPAKPFSMLSKMIARRRLVYEDYTEVICAAYE
ncbi:hypothetical protein C8F01DRAFT_1369053 [Mycena amicta]|nr:hypothetical protein C8F01DRAFT_1369053 [Mycena amicta]